MPAADYQLIPTMGILEAKNLEHRRPPNDKQNVRPPQSNLAAICIRYVIAALVAVGVYNSNTLQYFVNKTWAYLLTSWLFNSVYFESWFTTFCYAVMISIFPFTLHYMKFMDKYKVDPHITYEHTTMRKIVQDAVFYLTPLMVLDTTKVKVYHGVDPEIVAEKKKFWINTTQALPVDPPAVGELVTDLIASILLYDALFFCVHYVLHKNLFLYKHVHFFHHDHGKVHPHVTNQLTVIERLILILTANLSLKFFRSHPLTRALFIPAFIFMLVDNHTGYDLPFGLHRVVPFDLYGGSVAHYAHHEHGHGTYQPFFSYFDKFLLALKKSSTSVNK